MPYEPQPRRDQQAQRQLLYPTRLSWPPLLRLAGPELRQREVIVTNARIYTVDDAHPFVAAMAVRDGRIQFVGSQREALLLRGEIDATQELNYTAVCKSILKSGYTGYLGQEFVPKRDPLTSLSEAFGICDV